MSNLPGIIYDKSAQSDIELLNLYYKTFRAYYISMFYLLNKKYKESIGFCFRVESYLKQLEPRLAAAASVASSKPALTATDQTAELDKVKLADLDRHLKQLKSDLNQSKFKIQTNAILEDDSLDDIYLKLKEKDLDREKLEKIPLTERMDIYFEDSANLLNKTPNLAKFALNFEPIPCKPLFFDLALNHIELPSLEDKIDSKKQASGQQQGVKGIIKGLFGFR
jgi:signal recognition particle subunit SRP68